MLNHCAPRGDHCGLQNRKNHGLRDDVEKRGVCKKPEAQDHPEATVEERADSKKFEQSLESCDLIVY